MPPIRTTAPLGIMVRSDLTRSAAARGLGKTNHHTGGRIAPNDRDIELMRHVMAGRTNIAIGHLMCLSQKTVHNYLSALFVMLHAQNRTDLVIRAIRGGYLACPCRCRCAKGRVQRLHRPASSVEPAHHHHRRNPA